MLLRCIICLSFLLTFGEAAWANKEVAPAPPVFREICMRVLQRIQGDPLQLSLENIPLRVHAAEKVKGLYSLHPLKASDLEETTDVELLSAKMYARYRKRIFKETLLLINFLGNRDVPGMDGVVFGRNGRAVSNVSFKSVSARSSIPLGKYVKDALTELDRFSRDPEAWRMFYGSRPAFYPDTQNFLRLPSRDQQSEAWLKLAFEIFGIRLFNPRLPSIHLQRQSGNTALISLEVHFPQFWRTYRSRPGRAVIYVMTEGHRFHQDAILAAQARLAEFPSVESIELMSDTELQIIRRNEILAFEAPH